ncbi:hypothetical protein MAPG_04213 [Magnaporthiopsis poae ATCC 64411]|uniref:Protein kinase domain-containing protein n=1 Tax=Magnaporthiopsis poae (strain ATCC 64411 / 73-15) TaxID=644358 RepID=A0A0C4DW41_MAGP6|nr:hypothetical protein MAPG_04213 [Magnaporthiopsis poae ATCC 64411]
MSDIDIYDEFDAPEDLDDEEAGGPGRTALNEIPMTLSALCLEDDDDSLYVPVGQDGELRYQVLKKIGFGKTFAVFAIWHISQRRKMAMKLPVLPVPGRGASSRERTEYREQCDALRRETDCLLSLQQRIVASHPTISRRDGDGVDMTNAEMGVTGVQGADVNSNRDKYGHMWHKSLKRDTRFTWVLDRAHGGSENKLPATYFLLCNVGTLEQLREMCRRGGVRIPARFGARCMVHLFQAWTSTVGAHDTGVFQNDYAESNVFIHSPDAGKYPDCYLGDFGDAVEHQLPSVGRPSSSDWRKATLAYFEELVRDQVLGRQLESTARQPNDFNAKLWGKIGQEMEMFLTKLRKYSVNSAPSVVNGLVDRTTAQFARLEEQAAHEEPAPRVLEANFLAAVHKMKAVSSEILTFTSSRDCEREITSGVLVGLPENCAPVALPTQRKLLGL